jgi:hypothetical protein
MRTTLLILAGAAALAVAAPAQAQVYLGTDGPGVGVHIGVGERHHRRVYRQYDDDTYARGSCREVRSKTYRPDGRVVYRTKRICR